ncbi:peptidoglycan DD-metalloendopeptidase family protein [Sulfitobacter sp. MF3-043]|uniref:peptidoglycan DD-metalloendopeptidase family protein n=1 Tax=Sulfitobacter sediminivivens TaxID=3252902 RepID=UPI003EBDCA87
MAVGLVGMWMMIPWWTPYLYGVLFVLVTFGSFRHRKVRNRVGGGSDWIGVGVLGAVILLTGYGSYLGVYSIVGKTPSEMDVVDIASPLENGTYLVVQGGSNRIVNDHFMTLDTSVPRFAAWRGQSKGLDIVRINALGLRANGLQPREPERYYAFGAKLLAPCSGRVAAAVDGIPDMMVPEMDPANMLGNHVIIDCGDFFIVMAHFRNGSVLVAEGVEVTTGMNLGEIGNSGNSGEPHLHIHAQKDMPKDQPISGVPLAIMIKGQFYARNDRMFVK